MNGTSTDQTTAAPPMPTTANKQRTTAERLRAGIAFCICAYMLLSFDLWGFYLSRGLRVKGYHGMGVDLALALEAVVYFALLLGLFVTYQLSHKAPLKPRTWWQIGPAVWLLIFLSVPFALFMLMLEGWPTD